MKRLNILNNYKGVIIFYILVVIMSALIVLNNNRINNMNLVNEKTLVEVR